MELTSCNFEEPSCFKEELACYVSREINNEKQVKPITKPTSIWEHEDLAKVRIKVFRGHSGKVNRCQFINAASQVLSASVDCSVKIWQPVHGTQLCSMNNIHAINIADVHCLEDGSRFFSCGWDKKICLWDLETNLPIWSKCLADMPTCCKISHGGDVVCVGSDLYHSLSIFDTRSGEVIKQIKDYHKASLTSCSFTQKDARITTTSTDCTAKFFDLLSNKCTITLELMVDYKSMATIDREGYYSDFPREGHKNAVSSSSISNDERRFATASWDKTLHIWDISTGLQLVSGSADASVVVWDVENNVQKLKLQGHTGCVNDVHFSKDQSWLLSCGNDGTVRMWNIETLDSLPIILENKRACGVKVTKCTKCGKQFSIAELDNTRDITNCVFCRMQSPQQTWLSFKDDVES